MNNCQISIINVQETQPNNNNREISKNYESKELQKDGSYLSIIHIAAVLSATTVVLSPQLLIPRHNSIFYPNYWYEIMILLVAPAFMLSVRSVIECVIFTQEKKLIRFGVFLKMAMCIVVPINGLFFLAHCFWTLNMGFEHPMPLLGIFLYFGTVSIFLCCLWYSIMFPLDLRMNHEFRMKIKRYVIYQLWWIVIAIQKDLLSFLFTAISGHVQFLFAVLIPVAKQFNTRILTILLSKMAGRNEEMSNALMAVSLNVHYSLFVVIRLNGAETLTMIVMVFCDFLLHFWQTIQIIKLDKKTVIDDEEIKVFKQIKATKVRNLVLAEITEVIVPLAYAIGFAMAYFGPNAHLIGNVKNDFWAYKKVEDVGRLFAIQFLLFGIDSCSVALNAILLSKFGDVALINELFKAVKRYWMIFIIRLGQSIATYFALKDMNVALDMTLKFNWISQEGRKSFSCIH